MTDYRHHSAQARTSLRAGVFTVNYSGVFAPQTWGLLGMQMVQERCRASVSMDCFTHAVHDTSEHRSPICPSYLKGSPPGVWVVRPDQYANSLIVANYLADLGVVRTVFLQSFAALALEFAQSQTIGSCQ